MGTRLAPPQSPKTVRMDKDLLDTGLEGRGYLVFRCASASYPWLPSARSFFTVRPLGLFGDGHRKV